MLVPLVFSQFYNVQNAADLQLHTKYELENIESFDYTNLSEYGIKPFGYIFDVWKIYHEIQCFTLHLASSETIFWTGARGRTPVTLS